MDWLSVHWTDILSILNAVGLVLFNAKKADK